MLLVVRLYLQQKMLNATWDGMKVFCLFTDEYGNTASTGCATIYILPDE